MMLHGMCCTGEVWTGFREFFEAQGTRVYTPTLRPELRVGMRARPGAGLHTLRFADYVADLEQKARLIEAETGRKPAVIGHSMGGLLAQALAERDRVSAAVWISPSAPAGIRDLPTRLLWLGHSMLGGLRLLPPAIRPDRRTLDNLVLNALPAGERAAAHSSMVHESGHAFADLRHWPIDESKIRVRVLTVAASRDRLVPAKLVRLIAKKYAAIGGEFHEYRQHAHWLYAEPGWEIAAAELYAWLREATSHLDASQPPSHEAQQLNPAQISV
jgi:alpha-beta hydrolase superfamily lysophospholipase